MGKLSIHTMQDMWNAKTQDWKDYEEKLNRLRGIPHWPRELTQQLINTLQSAEELSYGEGNEPNLWSWSNCSPTARSFQLPNKIRYSLMLLESLEWCVLNGKWNRTDPPEVWEKRWKGIWASDLTRRAKSFLWKIRMNGLFTMARAQHMGHGNGCCTIFLGMIQNNNHNFHECYKANVDGPTTPSITNLILQIVVY